MSDFVSEGNVRDFGWDVRGIVLHGDDAGVQRLLLTIRV